MPEFRDLAAASTRIGSTLVKFSYMTDCMAITE
jgi:hypothetical protein